MANVALVTHDIQTIGGRAGGVAAFVTQFARLLRAEGESVTILLTRQETHPVHVDEPWLRHYRDWGIEVRELHNSEPSANRWADPWTARLSEQVTPLLQNFDIAYFQDWANVAFHAARVKRYSRAAMPVLVTVLHGPSGWIRVLNRQEPAIPADQHLDYIERYAARHSDFVVSPSRYMVDWTRQNGWEFSSEPAVLGLPLLDPPLADSQPASAITRLIFFGRLEPRKGLSLFAAALKLLLDENPGALRGLTEIVLLGPEKEPGGIEQARLALDPLAIPVRHLAELDSAGAREFLAKHAADSLAVVPSPVENFPYAVIEASRIPGLRLLCSRGGGTPEIFDSAGDAQFFEPYPRGLATRLAEWLLSPPPPESMATYDAVSANARWLYFHRAARPRAKAPRPRPAPANVDVCIPHFNQSVYLRQLLSGLERQTSRQFGVIVVDDGSSPAEKDAFAEIAGQYRDRGWKFVTQANSFVDAARNRAAALSQAPYLLFIDADDFPAPHAIERMCEAIELSGEDCLVAAGILFESEYCPYDFDAQTWSAEARAQYLPLGPDLVCGLLDPNVLGPSMILIRRAAFDAVGGYRERRGAAHEDWELQIRLVAAGYRVDVLPEFLLYFRQSSGGLSRTSDGYEARQRLIETYEEVLGKVGLRGIAAATLALLDRRRQLESALRENEQSRAARLHGMVSDLLRRKAAR